MVDGPGRRTAPAQPEGLPGRANPGSPEQGDRRGSGRGLRPVDDGELPDSDLVTTDRAGRCDPQVKPDQRLALPAAEQRYLAEQVGSGSSGDWVPAARSRRAGCRYERRGDGARIAA